MTSAFIYENTDRFGKPIYPKTMKDKVPGPHEYSHPISHLNNIGGYLPKIQRPQPSHGNPDVGPTTYDTQNSLVLEKQVSFLLN